MAINPNFLVAALDLSEVFVDKDTGQPLSGGKVYFYQDSDRTTAKLVYTIEKSNPGLPPTYDYIPLPNPITLSPTGQFQDNNGNNIPVYYYPVDANGVTQLYYIIVNNSNGVQQFVRQAWPPNESSQQPQPGGNNSGISNQITNSQFVDVNFVPANGITFNYVGNAIDTIAIAPGWNLVVNHSGNGQLLVARTAVQGSSAYPYNPPYTLTVTPGVNINELQLVQTLPNNPDVFSPNLVGTGTGGYISASILLGPASPLTTISYQPNGQAAQQLLSANNATGQYQQYNHTTLLQPASNPSTGDTGSVSIIINLNTIAATTFSNIQIVPLNANLGNIPYDQRTANRERDFESNYWTPLLKVKPIPSYLIGWDFPLNPTQVSGNGTIAAQATGGAAGSFQAWDQTVVFQSVTNGVTIARSASGSGAMTVTANAAAVQFAVIQYLPQALAREILNNPLSSMFSGLTNRVAGLNATISLWYTTNANLPSTGANLSVVTGLDANGHPNAVAAGWNEVPRGNLGNAQFTLGTSATTNWNDYGFSYWNLNGVAGVNTATWFAIVVGFAQFSNVTPDTVDIGSISLVPGNIATRPAPKSQGQVLRDCQTFYEKSFNLTVAPQQNIGNFTSGCDVFPLPIFTRVGQPFYVMQYVPFKVIKNVNNAAITTYNPSAANAEIRDIDAAADFVGTATQYVSQYGFSLSTTANAAGANNGDQCAVYWTADARLGL